jgi:hypothetical protein
VNRPALLAATLVGACVSTNAAVLDTSVRLAPLCPEAVTAYTSPDKVGKPYQEIALLNSKGESGYTSESGMISSQRKKAASLGANGIILGQVDEPKAGTKIIGTLLGTGSERKGKALAIYVPEDSLKNRRACARK